MTSGRDALIEFIGHVEETLAEVVDARGEFAPNELQGPLGETWPHIKDRTENIARVAERWRSAREARAIDLRRVEGDATFEGQQRFFEVATRLAAERRLSRFAFHARRS